MLFMSLKKPLLQTQQRPQQKLVKPKEYYNVVYSVVTTVTVVMSSRENSNPLNNKKHKQTRWELCPSNNPPDSHLNTGDQTMLPMG